jgi:hypothetical protein
LRSREPEPALGGYLISGLYNVAFAHENVSWGDVAVKTVFDTVIAADARSKSRLQEAQRRTRNPL